MFLPDYLLCQKLCRHSNRINLNLFSFGYSAVDTSWKGNVQSPSVSRLYYIIDGEAHIEFENSALSLVPGNWYLIPSGLSFRFWCEREMKHLFFHITLSDFGEMDLLGQYSNPAVLEDNADFHQSFMDYLEQDTPFVALCLKEKIYGILLEMMKKFHIQPELVEYSKCVQKAVEYIHANLSRKLDLTTIAKYSYVSKSTLTNKFREELHLTIQGYIQQQKMFRAEQMLKNSDMSIAQISEKLGFSEQFYFSKCFKQRFGLSPREYRNTQFH